MAIRWDPILDPKLKATRRPGRPKTRWTNDICNHLVEATNAPDDDESMTSTTPNNNERWLQMDSRQLAGFEDSFATALQTTAAVPSA